MPFLMNQYENKYSWTSIELIKLVNIFKKDLKGFTFLHLCYFY